MSKITIIGAGMMGSALAFPLSDNGHTVNLVGTPLDDSIIDSIAKGNFHPSLKFKMPKNVFPFHFGKVQEALIDADIVVGGVSSFGVEWFAENALPLIPETVPVISVTKGLKDFEDGSLITFPDYLQTLYPANKCQLCAIGGPCTSYELAARRHSAVTFCGKNMPTLHFLQSIFQTSYYHVDCSTDVIGVETAVAMKNAYALAVTMSIGITQSIDGPDCQEAYNPQAAIFAQSVREISRMLQFMGGEADRIVLAAGDLYVTVYGGRTRKLGILLGNGTPYSTAKNILKGITLESVEITTRTARAIRILANKGKVNISDFPLLLHVDDVITKGIPVNIPWHNFR